MSLRIKRHHCGTIAIEGDISVCPGCGAATVNGTSFHLQPQEASLLMRVALTPGKWVTKRELAEWIYGDKPDGGALVVDRVFRTQFHRIRTKINGTNVVFRELGMRVAIRCWYGVGYRLDSSALNLLRAVA